MEYMHPQFKQPPFYGFYNHTNPMGYPSYSQQGYIPQPQPAQKKTETSEPKTAVLRLDISTEKAQRELVNSVRKEKEEDELRKNFPDIMEMIKNLDKSYNAMKAAYEKNSQDIIKQLNESKSRANEIESTVNKKDAERKQLQIQMEEELAKLKEKEFRKYRKEIKGKNEIEYLSKKYSVSTLPRAYILNKLDKEIDEFYNWMKLESIQLNPTKEKILQEMLNHIHAVDPNLDLRIYGSHSVDLSIPSSDIDLIIIPTQRMFRNGPQTILQELQRVVQQQKYVVMTKSISNSSMPVLRIECNEEMWNIKLDVTVKDVRHKGIECSEMTKKMIEMFPAIEKLILVLKYVLKISELNDPYHGGLSSYGMLLLLIAYFQEFHKEIHDMKVSEILLGILHFYGNFNFHSTFVMVQYPWDPNSKGSIFLNSKDEFEVPMVIDPLVLTTTNVVTKSTMHMNYIKKMFRVAAKSISHHCVCSTHKNDVEEKRESMGDHCLLSNLFAAALPFKNNPYRKSAIL